MYKLMVFDLDNTLAKLGKGVIPRDLELLHQLEEKGARIVICSGKSTYYLCGFLRQVELQKPIIVGENGAMIQFGIDMPPKAYKILPYSEEARETIRFFKQEFDKILPNLCYQPNITGLTPFLASEEEFELIAECLKKNQNHIKDVQIYRHEDSYDITPNGITKYNGLECLGKWIDVLPEETVAVGDGVNDYPMFEYAGHAVGVCVADPSKVDKNFSTSTEALEYLLTLL